MRKRMTALLLTAAMLLTLLPAAALAAGEQPAYVFAGRDVGDGYELTISVRGGIALGGRVSLAYDTEKLILRNGDSFSALNLAPSVRVTNDAVKENELMDTSAGVLGFAWYTDGTKLDATAVASTVASLTFDYVGGTGPEDLDALTFRLRYVPDEGWGEWDCAADLFVNEGGKAPVKYHYLSRTGREAALIFDYEGMERPAEGGRTVTFQCKNVLGEPVRATVEVNGRSAVTDADGLAQVLLPEGGFAYRVSAAGYGERRGKAEVSGGSLSIPLEFVNDETLVRQAAAELEIGYYDADSAEGVTQTVYLPLETDTGVKVAWKSDTPAVLTADGLVYRPAHGKGNARVTLTADLSRGSAKAQTGFVLTVLEKPAVPEPERPAGGNGYEKPQDDSKAVNFQDLDNVPWAQEAILALASAGVIKGVGPDAFAPLQPISRGDFTVLLVRMMDGGAARPGADFEDVPPQSYYYGEIGAARTLGIAVGIGGNRFEPRRGVVRQEMMTLAARALGATEYLPASGEKYDISRFADADQVSAWAAGPVAEMTGRGFIQGDGRNVNPAGGATRAEAAVFLYRIWTAHGA